MIPWSRVERRWRDALLGAMIPPGPGHPGIAGAPDAGHYLADLDTRGPPLLRLGLRAAVWVLTWLGPLLVGALRPFHRLPADARDRCLQAAATSRWYLLRQLVLTLKTVACLAYLRDPHVRDALDAVAHPALQ